MITDNQVTSLSNETIQNWVLHLWFEANDDDVEPNYCYMAINDQPGRSIIQQVKSMISDNKFDLFVCEPYLTQIQSDMIVIHKSYESTIKVSEKLDSELTRLRLSFEDRKLKIESAERELLMAKDECIILNEKCAISIS